MRHSIAVLVTLSLAGAAQAAPPSVGGCQIFPTNNYWNTPVDTLPVHASSNAWVSSVGNTAKLHADWGNVLADNYGIPFTTVTVAQPLVPIAGDPDPDLDYSDESDPGPYPIPPTAPIEAGGLDDGDRHVLVIETTNCILYELYHAYPINGGASWTASSFAKWPLNSNNLRPADWTSADAAGLPVFSGLVRWEEVQAGAIEHAIRFTAQNIWGFDAGAGHIKYLWPARHNSGSNSTTTRPPMGARFRLKSSYVIPAGYNNATKVILTAMKKYGMVLADGGSNWFFQGVSNASWPDAVFSELGQVAGSNFEVVDTSLMMVSANSGQAQLPAPNLSVTMVPSPNPASAGKDVAYAITLSNVGNGGATGVTLTDTLPGGTAFIWASPGCNNAAGTVTCNVGNVAAGASVPLKVVVRPASAGSIMNTATAAPTDAVPGNNTASSTITVNATPAGVPIQRYRLYSDVTKEHHFTTDLNEYNVLGTFVGTWVQEGPVGKVLNNPGSFNAVVAVPYYRLYDTNTRWHHWTTDTNEYYTLGYVYAGWNLEGVDGYILPTATAGATQLYRLNYPALGALHHWTIDANEYNTLITPAYGWVGEGGSGFVIQ